MFRIIIAIALLGSMLLVFGSCSKDDNNGITPPQNQDAVISDNVYIVEEGSLLSLVELTDSTIQFSFTGEPPTFEKGDIVVGRESGGYFRKVRVSNQEAGVLSILTDTAALADAVIKGSFDTTIQLNIGSYDKIGYNMKLIQFAQGVSVSDSGINFSNTILYEGSFHGVDLLVKILDGYATFNPSLSIGCHFDWGLKEFHAIASGDIVFVCDALVECNQGFDLTREENLASFEKDFVIGAIGPLPIWAHVTVHFIAGFELIAEGHQSLTAGFDSHYGVDLGARYNNQVWSPVWTQDAILNEHPLIWENHETIHARVYVRPVIDIKIESAAGPKLEVEPYLGADAEFIDAYHWSWDLYSGISANLGFTVTILDNNLLNYNKVLIEQTYPIASESGEIPNSKPAANAGGPYTGIIGEIIQYYGSGTDPDSGDYITQYKWVLLNDTSMLQNPTEIPIEEGTYQISLKVRDQRGAESTGDYAAVTIISDDMPPVAEANGPYVGTIDEEIQFSSVNSYDPDGDLINGWYWDFHDGSSSIEESPENSWPTPGTYYPTLLVKANNKWSSTADTCEVIVTQPSNHAPIAEAGGPYTAKVGDVIHYYGNGTDPDEEDYIIAYHWELVSGDNDLQNPSEIVNEQGDYSVRLKVQDNHGLWGDWDYATVHIYPDDRRPIADAGGPYDGIAGQEVQLNSDASYDPDGDQIIAWYWNFHDGTDSDQANPKKVWESSGIYYPKMIVYANEKWSDSSQCTVTIGPNPYDCLDLELFINRSSEIVDTVYIGDHITYGGNIINQCDEAISVPYSYYIVDGNYKYKDERSGSVIIPANSTTQTGTGIAITSDWATGEGYIEYTMSTYPAVVKNYVFVILSR